MVRIRTMGNRFRWRVPALSRRSIRCFFRSSSVFRRVCSRLWREKLCARAAGVWVGAQVGICGVGGVLCVFPVDSASDHRAVRGRIGDVFPVCGKIFPDLIVFHVLKLCSADCVEPVYGDWKTEKGYFPVPDAPDSLFAAADCDSAAVYRH